MKRSVSIRGVLASVAALPLASKVPVSPMLSTDPKAAISGQLPADNETATRVLNVVFEITDAVCDLDSIDRQKAFDIFGELLLTVENDDDLDDVYGLLDRLLQERRELAGKNRSAPSMLPV
jgi:hypothetical protein